VKCITNSLNNKTNQVKAWWNIGKRKRARKQVYGQLQQQRVLLQQGVNAHARIMEIVHQLELMKGYMELRVWVMIRLQGKLLYQQVHTMVSTDKMPVPGEVVPIRILPDNTSVILIIS
jgi:hypothetical protein